MQPWYIVVMWLAAVAFIFGADTLTIFSPHTTRDFWQFLGFIAVVLAASLTLLSNKRRFGLFFPGAKRKRP
jgi:hypothetical protein